MIEVLKVHKTKEIARGHSKLEHLALIHVQSRKEFNEKLKLELSERSKHDPTYTQLGIFHLSID